MIVALLGGCSKRETHEQLARETVATFGDLLDAMKSVHDDDSARKAAAKIDRVHDHVVDIKDRQRKLAPPTTEEAEAIAQINATMQPMKSELFDEMQRVDNHESWRKALLPAIQKLTGVVPRPIPATGPGPAAIPQAPLPGPTPDVTPPR